MSQSLSHHWKTILVPILSNNTTPSPGTIKPLLYHFNHSIPQPQLFQIYHVEAECTVKGSTFKFFLLNCHQAHDHILKVHFQTSFSILASSRNVPELSVSRSHNSEKFSPSKNKLDILSRIIVLNSGEVSLNVANVCMTHLVVYVYIYIYIYVYTYTSIKWFFRVLIYWVRVFSFYSHHALNLRATFHWAGYVCECNGCI